MEKWKKENYRLVLRLLFFEGKPRNEIEKRLDDLYGDASSFMATVENWLKEFHRVRTSVFVKKRTDAQKTASTENLVRDVNKKYISLLFCHRFHAYVLNIKYFK